MSFEAAVDAYELLCDAARLDREVPALARLLGPTPLRVLDLACGLGDHLAALLAQQVISGGTGLDLSAGMIARARERHPDPRLDFHTGDLAAVDVGDHDAVLCLGNALNCLPDQDSALAALGRLAGHPARLVLHLVNPRVDAPAHASVVRGEGDRRLVKTVVQVGDRSLLTCTVHRRLADGWHSTSDHQILLRLEAGPIEQVLRRAGRQPRRLGGWDGAAWTPSSTDLIVVA